MKTAYFAHKGVDLDSLRKIGVVKKHI